MIISRGDSSFVIDYSLFLILARNLEKGETNEKDFNLHDHPLLPVNIPDNKVENPMGKLVPIDIVRNVVQDPRR